MAARKPDQKTSAEVLPAVPAGGLVETAQVIEIISGLARSDCPLEEIAAVFKVKPEEMREFLILNPASFKAYTAGPAAGRAEIRAAQHSFAKKGDSRLLVWLGRQRLNQTDDGAAAGDVAPDPGAKDWDDMATWRMPRH